VQEELLDKYPNANVRVYAVWFNMVPSDSRARWPDTLLTDPRVAHRWDEPRAAGRWFAERASTLRPFLTPGSRWGDREILWDSFLLYGTDASWSDTPTGLIHWGRTIVAGRETLKADFDTLFGTKK
jgi:hypothetical protein